MKIIFFLNLSPQEAYWSGININNVIITNINTDDYGLYIEPWELKAITIVIPINNDNKIEGDNIFIYRYY